MSRKIFKALWLRAALCVGAVCGATPAGAAVEDFLGTWVNVGRNDAGITHVVVTRAGLGVNVEIYGDCQPRDCNQGNVRGTIYAPEPGADPFRSAIAVAATFNAGFSQKFIVLREARGSLMTLDMYTSFTDRSRRSNYTASARMRRGPPPVAGFPRGPQGYPTDWWQQQYGRVYSYRDDVFYQECRQSPDPAGVIAGALIGGILGRVAGEGRAGPTVAGVIVGGAVGAALTQNLDCEDRSYAYRAYYDGLNGGYPNRTYEWRNPRSGRYGSFHIGEYYDDPYGFRCAPYSQTIFINGRPQVATGNACQQPDGTWAIVQ
jgi:surface antigen